MTVVESRGPWFGMRHAQALLIFLNITVLYISRLNIAVAIVAMTNAETTNPNFPEYDWSENEQQIIISSFYWGYIITQFPGGFFARQFGCKITMFCATFGSAVFSLITPFCVPWGGWKIYCALRIVEGLFQGVVFPCIHAHLANWSPLQERNRLGALSQTGIECGNVLAMGITGLIAAGPMGWPGISYISAALCFIWCALWLVFSADSPPASNFITAEEREYIEISLKRDEKFHAKQIPIPWRGILTSIPFYALLVARCAQGWGFSTIQAEIPSYLQGVFNLNIKKNALYSTLPYIAMWIMSYVYLFIADFTISRNLTSLTKLRKTFNSISSWIPALGLCAVGFLDEHNSAWAIVIMTINVGFNSGTTIGSGLNTIDLSPNHAGVLMGIINCIANFAMLLTPLVVGIIVTNKHERAQWQIVFLIAALIFFVGNLVYILFGTAETQYWNDTVNLLPKDEESNSKDEKHSSPLERISHPSELMGKKTKSPEVSNATEIDSNRS